MPDRILRHLNEDGVARLQSCLDTTRLAFHTDGIPVHLARVEDCVAPAAHIHERGLHRGKDILHATQVDVADHRRLRTTRDVVLTASLTATHLLRLKARRAFEGLHLVRGIAAFLGGR